MYKRQGERRVKVAGEAMFDVEHDPAHPFVVETFACDVEVLGTKFDVMAEEREGLFSAALLRGSVKVTNRLTPGEQFVLDVYKRQAPHRALCRGAGRGGGRRRRSRADACRRPDRRVGAADDGARSACGTVPELSLIHISPRGRRRCTRVRAYTG